MGWSEASASVIEMAKELIDEFHPHLKEARIGFIFRDEAPVSRGNYTLGKATKVSERMKVLIDLDFVIWIAEDVWEKLDTERRRALIDHELCHCRYDPADGASIRNHDVEEFVDVVERHGFWSCDLLRLESIAKGQKQLKLDLGQEQRGEVVKMEVKQVDQLAFE